MAVVIENSYAAGPEEAHIRAFTDTIEQTLQQEQSPIWDTIDMDNYIGVRGHWDRIEAFTADEKTGRHEEQNEQTAKYSRRRMDYRTPYIQVPIDINDIENMGRNPQSSIVKGIVSALNREKDQYVIDAFFSDVVVGDPEGSGDTTVSFPSANVVAVDYKRGGGGSNTNLNPEKLLRAREILAANQALNKMQKTYVGLTASQYYAMMLNDDVKTIDSFDTKPIVDAQIKGVAGFAFVLTEQLNTDTNSYREIPVWTEDAMKGTQKEEMYFRIFDNDKRHFEPTVYARCMCNAKRAWEEAVVKILCDETKAS